MILQDANVPQKVATIPFPFGLLKLQKDVFSRSSTSATDGNQHTSNLTFHERNAH
jgi:hypothetical protein